MRCPNCKAKYNLSRVPMENRRMKFLVTEFICPYCKTWLRPDKRFSNIVTIAILLGVFGIICLFADVQEYKLIVWFGIILVASSVFIFIYGMRTLNLEEIHKQETDE